MELLAFAGLFVGLALVAAVPLVLLLQLSHRGREEPVVSGATPETG